MLDDNKIINIRFTSDMENWIEGKDIDLTILQQMLSTMLLKTDISIIEIKTEARKHQENKK